MVEQLSDCDLLKKNSAVWSSWAHAVPCWLPSGLLLCCGYIPNQARQILQLSSLLQKHIVSETDSVSFVR